MIEVNLPPDVEEYARDCVAKGLWPSLDEVVTAAILHLRLEQEALDEELEPLRKDPVAMQRFREELDAAVAAIDAGAPTYSWEEVEEELEQIIRNSEKRRA